MKKIFTLLLLLLSLFVKAQVGVGTTSPNSTLDVRGALSLNLRVFTGTTTTISSTDNTVIFTGTTASTATLPDATACAGRIYRIMNASTTSPTPALTIATTSSQTIDGISTWVLDEGYGSIAIVSNGTNWLISSQSVPKSSGSAWLQGGNAVSAVKNLGTTSNYDLPFITNNTEKMRLTATGSLGIGTSTFNATYPEKLIVDGGSTGNTNYQNVIVGKGNTNSYAQLNIQNNSSGTGASSDVVATANNGSETVNYVDMGVNGGGNTSTGVLGGANTAYLYSTGNDFAIGNGTNSKNLNFFTTTGGTYTERMRIDGNGNVGIGTSTFNGTYPEQLIVDAGSTGNTDYQNVIVGKGNTNSYAQLNIQNAGSGTAASSDVVATANNGSESVNYIDMGINGGGNTSTGILGGANTGYLYTTGNDFAIGNATSAKDLILFTGGTATTNERLRATANGITVTGSFTVSYKSVSNNYTLLSTDYVVINTGAGVTLTLPAASGCTGRVYKLVNHGTANITLSLAVTTANGSTTTSLSYVGGFNSYEIISDGTVWRRIN